MLLPNPNPNPNPNQEQASLEKFWKALTRLLNDSFMAGIGQWLPPTALGIKGFYQLPSESEPPTRV